MYPQVFEMAGASPAVRALLGQVVVRFWPFDLAPGPNERNYGLPYATHQLVYGSPENTLSCPAATDNVGLQIDSYGRSVTESRNVAISLRQALEGGGYIVALNGEFWERETGLYRSSFTVEFYVDR